MTLNLRLADGTTEAKIRYGTFNDLAFINQWDKAVELDKNPVRLDACLFARLAIKRFQTHHRLEMYATSVQEISDFTRDNPQAEVANFVLLESASSELGRTIGVCHFRRTWCNNVAIDYLSVHPLIARPRNNPGIQGAGTALLYFVSTVAIMTNAALLWGEATQNSCTFYNKALRLEDTRDLIYASRDHVKEFVRDMQSKYRYPVK